MITYVRSGASLITIFILILLTNACEKTEDVIKRDSEQLMKDLQGKWNLVSVRDAILKTTNGGLTWNIDTDTTYAATGELDFASIDKQNYTGSISILYGSIDEAHSISGNAYKNTVEERVEINTVDQSDIEAFVLYTNESSSNDLYLEERDQEHFLMWISENANSTTKKERIFRFERAR